MYIFNMDIVCMNYELTLDRCLVPSLIYAQPFMQLIQHVVFNFDNENYDFCLGKTIYIKKVKMEK